MTAQELVDAVVMAALNHLVEDDPHECEHVYALRDALTSYEKSTLEVQK